MEAGYDEGWFGFVFGAGWAAPGAAAGDFDCGAIAGGGGWWVFGGVGVGLFFLFLGGLEVVEIEVMVVVGIERLMLCLLVVVVVLEIRVLTHVGKQGVCVMILSLPMFAFHDLSLSLSRSIWFD